MWGLDAVSVNAPDIMKLLIVGVSEHIYESYTGMFYS